MRTARSAISPGKRLLLPPGLPSSSPWVSIARKGTSDGGGVPGFPGKGLGRVGRGEGTSTTPRKVDRAGDASMASIPACDKCLLRACRLSECSSPASRHPRQSRGNGAGSRRVSQHRGYRLLARAPAKPIGSPFGKLRCPLRRTIAVTPAGASDGNSPPSGCQCRRRSWSRLSFWFLWLI